MSSLAGNGAPSHARNDDLQALRGIAALLVLLYHASFYLEAERGDGRMLAVFGGEFGLLGVAIFFAMSGALMARILPRTAPATFLLHRVARIYPSFLLASLALPPLLLAEFWQSQDLNWRGWLVAVAGSWTLVPIGPNGAYFLRIEWTLLFELFYYVVLTFLAVLGLARRLAAFAVLWLAAVLLALALLPAASLETLTPTLLTVAWLPANAAFALGLLAPALAARGLFRPATAAVAAIVAALAMTRFGLAPGRVVAGVCALVPVGLALRPPTEAGPGGALRRLAARLGDWSFALYLAHVPVVLFVYRTLDAPPLAAWGVAVAAAIAASIPFGMLDLRLYAVLRRRIDAMSERARTVLAALFVLAYALVAAFFAWHF